ncbi:MAG: hypothetical protein ACJ0Q9_00670 [Gammaproteobacteria bacterium]
MRKLFTLAAMADGLIVPKLNLMVQSDEVLAIMIFSGGTLKRQLSFVTDLLWVLVEIK